MLIFDFLFLVNLMSYNNLTLSFIPQGNNDCYANAVFNFLMALNLKNWNCRNPGLSNILNNLQPGKIDIEKYNQFLNFVNSSQFNSEIYNVLERLIQLNLNHQNVQLTMDEVKLTNNKIDDCVITIPSLLDLEVLDIINSFVLDKSFKVKIGNNIYSTKIHSFVAHSNSGYSLSGGYTHFYNYARLFIDNNTKSFMYKIDAVDVRNGGVQKVNEQYFEEIVKRTIYQRLNHLTNINGEILKVQDLIKINRDINIEYMFSKLSEDIVDEFRKLYSNYTDLFKLYNWNPNTFLQNYIQYVKNHYIKIIRESCNFAKINRLYNIRGISERKSSDVFDDIWQRNKNDTMNVPFDICCTALMFNKFI